jgi:hypothetical protein
LDVQVVSRRPFTKPSKHCQRCTRPVREFSPVQLRVGAPVLVTAPKDRNRASAQAGFISQLRRGQHSGLRPFASMQQPANFFCKKALPGQHRLGTPSSLQNSNNPQIHFFAARVVQAFAGGVQETRRRERRQCPMHRDREHHFQTAASECWSTGVLERTSLCSSASLQLSHTPLLHFSHGAEATADRHRTFNPVW